MQSTASSTPRVLIVGAGRIGARYFQGLAGCKLPLSITVSDISSEMLVKAEALWKETPEKCASHVVRMISSLDELPSQVDIAILATPADIRPRLVRTLVSKVEVRYWVLEKILAQSDQYVEQIVSAVARSKGAWVNTPMHMWSLYKNLRDVCNDSPIHARYDDVRGLACNAIHYIDLVSRWNDAALVEMDTSGLDSAWYPAERAGFFDVWGRLVALFSDGSRLEVTSKERDRQFRARLSTAGDEWQIVERDGYARNQHGTTVYGKCEFQSELTARLVESLLDRGTCDLPTLAESAAQHRVYLRGLLTHWNRTMPNQTGVLPIT